VPFRKDDNRQKS